MALGQMNEVERYHVAVLELASQVNRGLKGLDGAIVAAKGQAHNARRVKPEEPDPRGVATGIVARRQAQSLLRGAGVSDSGVKDSQVGLQNGAALVVLESGGDPLRPLAAANGLAEAVFLHVKRAEVVEDQAPLGDGAELFPCLEALFKELPRLGVLEAAQLQVGEGPEEDHLLPANLRVLGGASRGGQASQRFFANGLPLDILPLIDRDLRQLRFDAQPFPKPADSFRALEKRQRRLQVRPGLHKLSSPMGKDALPSMPPAALPLFLENRQHFAGNVDAAAELSGPEASLSRLPRDREPAAIAPWEEVESRSKKAESASVLVGSSESSRSIQ